MTTSSALCGHFEQGSVGALLAVWLVSINNFERGFDGFERIGTVTAFSVN